MQDGVFAGEVRAAIDDLQAYLSDQVAPLLVADSLELLVAQPPELGAETLRSWVGGQVRGYGGAASPVPIGVVPARVARCARPAALPRVLPSANTTSHASGSSTSLRGR